VVSLAVCGVVAALAVLSVLVDRGLRSPRNGLVIALASLALLTTLSAKFGSTVGRYAVLSGISLLWLLLAHTRSGVGIARWRAVAAGVAFGWALLVGAGSYREGDGFAWPRGWPR